MHRGQSFNNKMMPQHIQGVNIIKNASVIVSSIARPNNEANYIKLTE